MIAPIPPYALYGIWDPEGGAERSGRWMLALDGDIPAAASPILAFGSRPEAQLAAEALMAKHHLCTGRRPFFVVESMLGMSPYVAAGLAARD